MRKYYYNKLTAGELINLTKRPAVDFTKAFETVRPILNDVKKDGLKAALNYAKIFDLFDEEEIRVSEKEFIDAENNIDKKSKSAIDLAAKNIEKFHRKQYPKSYSVEIQDGINCSREFRAIENVGLYIPGGNAVLPSTMLMLGIPARIAKCRRVVVCSPAKNGKINYPLLYAAKICGATEFYKIGGAQAIALMAFGSSGIPKVTKIFGPGNQYVTAAKLLASIDQDGAAIDMPAGPSELVVIADKDADPIFAAADLLSQAEHGADSQVVLLSDSEEIVNKINSELVLQLNELPRKEFAEKSLQNFFSLITETLDQAIEFSNRYAPEHLILNFKNADKYRSKIQNGGSVFIGGYSPESAGDYATGTNHSLPTSGFAATFGGVTVEAFMKSMTFQKLSKQGLKKIAPAVETLAEAEGLLAHKKAVSMRFKKFK
ncbi:MAG TPA: histidinol dehydrogenase [Ignavibacteriaceae bacterium]|nr:histidinol dehydrogenase [Ignavibacteriaceae bacterium]